MMTRDWMLAALALTLIAGCEKKAKPLEGPPLRVEFGDCTKGGGAFVSGPKPAAFDEELLAMMREPIPVAPREPEPPPAPEPEPDPLALDEGKMGKIDSARERGQYQMKGNLDPQLSREQAIEAAREAGILGQLGEMQGGFGVGTMSTGSANDEGGQVGWGTIGTGRYGTIGHGSGTGSGYGVGKGRGGMRASADKTPQVRIGNTTAVGDLDRNIIRRYIRRKLPQIKYCYEKQLIVTPGLAGTVVAEFTISPEGAVPSSRADGVSEDVSSCVAAAIQSIQFPKPKGGGIVQVRYPFDFRPSAATGADSEAAAPEAPPTPEPAPPAPAWKTPYVAGTDNPLRPHGPAIAACFRRHGKAYGALLIELSFGEDGVATAPKAHGDLGEALAGCVTAAVEKARWENARGSRRRCSVVVGTATLDQPAGRGGGPVPLVDITAEQISFDDTTLVSVATVMEDTGPSWKIVPLYERAVGHRQQQRRASDNTDVAITGPGVIRAVGTTPMKVINRALMSLAAAELDFVLAAEAQGEWRILRGIELPVVPVPRGSGRTWNPRFRAVSARSADAPVDEPPSKLSILVTREAYWIGLSAVGEREKIERTGDARDAASLRDTLATMGATPGRKGRSDAEIAANDDIAYADVVGVIDQAIAAGLSNWMVTHPDELSTRFMR